MNLAAVAKILAGFVLFFSVAQAIPLGFALLAEEEAAEDTRAVRGFAWGSLSGMLVASALWLAGRRAGEDFFRREALAVVGLAWVLAGTMAGIPFLLSGALPDPANAVFESISGLTTTGATVLGSPETPAIEELPRSLLLWRAMLQWLGGMGIILAFIVLLPAMGVTGKNLLASEQIGVPDYSQGQRMQEQARALCLLYLGLTAADAGLLRLAGMGWFDAVCHAFTTVAIGGFSTHGDSIGGYDSLAIELITIFFMLVAGMNFVVLLSVARIRFRRPTALLAPTEIRVYLAMIGTLVLVAALLLRLDGETVVDGLTGRVRDYRDLGTCLRDAAFNIVSIHTTTGYATADYQAWPAGAIVVFLWAMLVGGCTGSTAGGLKILRMIVAGKLIAYAVRHFLRPKSIEKVRVGAEVVPNGIISAIVALTLLWLLSIVLGTLALSLDARLDLLTAFSANVSMMGCVGPALTDVAVLDSGEPGAIDVGPAGTYGLLSAPAKLLLCVEMIFGRLEILAPLTLFLPGLWRR